MLSMMFFSAVIVPVLVFLMFVWAVFIGLPLRFLRPDPVLT